MFTSKYADVFIAEITNTMKFRSEGLVYTSAEENMEMVFTNNNALL